MSSKTDIMNLAWKTILLSTCKYITMDPFKDTFNIRYLMAECACVVSTDCIFCSVLFDIPSRKDLDRPESTNWPEC